MKIKETLSINLKFIRYSLGVPTKVLSERIGMNSKDYNQIENNRCSIKLNTLDRIAKGLNIKPCELIREREDFTWENLPHHIRKKMYRNNKAKLKLSLSKKERQYVDEVHK